MSITFTSIPPSNDSALLSMLGAPRPITVRFERPKTLVREIVRVANASKEHPIVGIAAPDLCILRGFEKLPPFDEAFLPDVKTASYTVKIQPGCPKQIERLCRLFQTHRSILTLSVSLFDYVSDEFVDTPMPDFLPPMLKPPTEDERIGRRLVDSLFAGCQKRIGYDMERAILDILHPETAAPEDTTGYTDEFYRHHLPERLEHLTLKAPIQGPGVGRDFLFVLPNLRSLDLSFCSIDDDAFGVIGPVIGQRLPRLETLVLARNRLRDALLSELVGPSLAAVDLSYNPVTSKALYDLFEGVENTSNPMRLDLSHSRIVERVECIGLRGVQLYMPNCVLALDLGGSRIDDRAFLALAPFLAIRMPAVQRLALARNRLQDARLGELVRRSLRELDLSRNPITARAATSLLLAMEGNATLASVDLSKTAITADLEFARIQHWRARPAVLRMPACFEGAELWRMMAFVPEGVEVQMESEVEEREMIGNE